MSIMSLFSEDPRLFRKALLLSLLPTAFALAQFAPEVSFCSAGIQPDGYLDWSKLPSASGTGALTATIPVVGISGLTATVYIPANVGSDAGGGGSSYNVSNPNQVTFGVSGDQNPLIISFNQPVKAINLNVRTNERFGHHIRVFVNDTTGNTVQQFPAQAQLDASGWDYPSQQIIVSPFQIVSRDANLTSVAIESLFGGEGPGFDLLNFRVQSAAAPDRSSSIPKNGLLAWYRADKLVGNNLYSFGATVTQWPDSSANNGLASGSGTLNLDGSNCSPVMTNGSFNFPLPINGLTGMTVIMATNTYGNPGGSNNAALFWGEVGSWGLNFFSPSQSTVNWRFGTGQPGNNPVYQRPMNVAADFTVSSFVHSNSIDSLFVNAQLADEVRSRYSSIANASNTATIGAGYNGSQLFPGGIGEILIYDRALTSTERLKVELYLMAKYGVK